MKEEELKNKVSKYLEMEQNGELPLVTINNLEMPNLIPNYPYLVYNIEDEAHGRHIYTNISIFIGYYNPEPVEPENGSNEILLENAIVLEYTLKGANIVPNPVNDIQNNKISIEETEIKNVPIDKYTKIYKLPLSPLDVERIPGMKEEFEEARWAPLTVPSVPFIGKKYRKAHKKFNKTVKYYSRKSHKGHKGHKGGNKTEKHSGKKYKKTRKEK